MPREKIIKRDCVSKSQLLISTYQLIKLFLLVLNSWELKFKKLLVDCDTKKPEASDFASTEKNYQTL